MMDMILAFPPTVPTGDPATIVSKAITFFETWITRAGGLIAFVGAIKFAISIRTEDEKEMMTALLTMVSGFMIWEAVDTLDLFNIPEKYSEEAVKTTFESLTKFIGKWTGRVGVVGCFAGALQFGLGIKDNNATSKVIGLKGMTAGAIVTAIAGALHLFV